MATLQEYAYSDNFDFDSYENFWTGHGKFPNVVSEEEDVIEFKTDSDSKAKKLALAASKKYITSVKQRIKYVWSQMSDIEKKNGIGWSEWDKYGSDEMSRGMPTTIFHLYKYYADDKEETLWHKNVKINVPGIKINFKEWGN
jgi:hypothetical protein